MNISFLRNAQAEEKEEMSYFCMHAPAADGHAAAQMPAGAGRGVPAGAAPGPPRQLQHPQPWRGSHTHCLHARMRHHQQRTLPRDTHPAVLLPSPSTLRTQHPCPWSPRAGGGWGGLAPSTHSRVHRSLCRRITPERERGCPASPQIFLHKLRPRRKPAPGKN